MSITLCNNNLATCSCSLPYNLPDIYHLAVLHITCCRLLSVQLLFSSSISARDCDSAACPMAVTGNSEGKVPCGVCCGCSHSCRRLLALNNDHIQPRAALQLRICETTCLTGNNSLWSNSSALQSGVWIIIFHVWGVFLFLFLFSFFIVDLDVLVGVLFFVEKSLHVSVWSLFDLVLLHSSTGSSSLHLDKRSVHTKHQNTHSLQPVHWAALFVSL